ncbi:hypothetical protein ABBQ32_004277 [Trebouxia sp. C0010 RCD-2024]
MPLQAYLFVCMCACNIVFVASSFLCLKHILCCAWICTAHVPCSVNSCSHHLFSSSYTDILLHCMFMYCHVVAVHTPDAVVCIALPAFCPTKHALGGWGWSLAAVHASCCFAGPARNFGLNTGALTDRSQTTHFHLVLFRGLYALCLTGAITACALLGFAVTQAATHKEFFISVISHYCSCFVLELGAGNN